MIFHGAQDRPSLWVRGLARLDALFNRVYRWRCNPLYQTGSLAVVLFVILLVTGLYLLIFYRIGSPYASVVAISEQAWTGRWTRALHRYASGALVVAVALHALRMGIQRRSWGPRVMAWVTGLVLVGLVMICGWTGYVMVWDDHGQALAMEGARFLDALPIFGDPVARAFSGERAIPGAFFFLNLFLHILLPVGLALVLWLHVSRVARPTLFPPRALGWGLVGLLVAISILWPAPMGEEGNLLRLPGRAPLDLFYGFWLPLTPSVPAWTVWVAGGTAAALFLLVPRWQRPPAEEAPAPSVVDERLCTGCEQCYLDCPYDAIQMLQREDERAHIVARVTPELCVSCGICTGSCAPMGVGPPGRTGRDQLGILKDAAAEGWIEPGSLVVVACDRGAGWVASGEELDGARVVPVRCAGNLHTSFVEGLLRRGAAGVLVAACPPRDCWNREGSTWLEARMYHDREAELQERVDRRRVALAFAGGAEEGIVREALSRLRVQVEGLDRPASEVDPELDLECDRPVREEGTPETSPLSGLLERLR
jgi:coenzyme F420-reducing hydrogenase delta subunit/Pyruvate/2-oxoacid:ferredoxin oxidoreductase delta subunit